MTRFPRAAGLTALLCALLQLLGPPASAQFKELGPAPFSQAVAHQRIRTLLDQVEPANRQQTIDQLNSLVPWFRNVLDEELIAGWQKDGRERLTLLMEPMADPHVAVEVVGFSWRKRTEATLNPAYAAMLGHLMARYPESSKEFLADLLGSAPPELAAPQAEAVCRILLDMPDVGNWNQSALQILPRYRATAERLLIQDRQGDDQEKRYRAQTWLAQLRGERPGAIDQPAVARRSTVSPAPDDSAGPLFHPSPAAVSSRSGVDRVPEPTTGNRPAQPSPPPERNPAPAQALPAAAPVPAAPQAYNGARSGTLECSGSPIPQNAEYVFRNLPLLKLQLDYDTRVWEARLAPAENQSQRLILKNKSSGPQKRCVVHWSVAP
jgi:hypothetical protein